MENFKAVISRWGTVATLAADLGIPEPTAYSWHQRDTIPLEWCAAVVRAAASRGFDDITPELLQALGERRRLARRNGEDAVSQESAA